MKILVFGHSLCAPRQTRFWRYFASLGHTILVLAPRRWMFHEVKDSEDGNFTIKGVDLFGGLRVRGLLDITREFKPDIIYSNEPTYSGGSLQAVQVGKELGVTVAVFEWDNVYHTSPLESKVLENADILIPGCPGARRILKKKGVPENKLSKPIIQVGVDTNLFKPLKIKKEFDTVTCAGFTENKGITDIKRTVKKLGLKHLWLGASRPYDKLKEPIDYGYAPGWMNYKELPKWYNKAKVHVLFSHDTPEWKEQYTYSIAESLACGLYNVISDAGEWKYLWGNTPAGVIMVQQLDTEALKKGIIKMLDYEGENGRKYVSENFGYEKIAEELVKVFGKSWT